MRWCSPVAPSVSKVMACVWPRVNRALPCVRGMTPTSHEIALISSSGTTVGAPLVDGDAAPDDGPLEVREGTPDLHEPLRLGVFARQSRRRSPGASSAVASLRSFLSTISVT